MRRPRMRNHSQGRLPCGNRPLEAEAPPRASLTKRRSEGVGGESTLGVRYIYFCTECRKVLGVSQRKGFWMR